MIFILIALVFTAGSGIVCAGLQSLYDGHVPSWYWIVASAAVASTLVLNMRGVLTTKRTLLFLLVEMFLIGGLAFAGGQMMHFGWAVFHIIIILLQAFIFMMLTIVYLSMAHEQH